MTHSVIARNEIVSANKGMIMGSVVPRLRSDIVIENNVVHGVADQCINLYDIEELVVRFNTCWDTGYGFWLRDESVTPTTHTTDAEIYGNVFGPGTRASFAVNNELTGFADWGSEDHNLVGERLVTQSFDRTDIVAPSAAALAGLFADAGSGVFVPQASSLLVDGVVGHVANPPADFAGAPRSRGLAPDIGALEFAGQ
jgi:hypothetical protein